MDETVPDPTAEIFSGETLPGISWLSSLSEDERSLFSRYGSKVDVEAGETLIREAVNQPYFYFVLKGMLSVRRTSDDGVESVVAVISAGESIGEMTMMSNGPASATVVTLEPCHLWRISHEELMKFISENHETGNKILLALLSTVSERLLAVNSDLAMLLSERRANALKSVVGS